MLKQLFDKYVQSYLDDQDYFKVKDRLAEINLERVQKISLTIFGVLLFIAIIPNTFLYLNVPEKHTEEVKWLIILEISLAVFMLLFHKGAKRLKTEKTGNYKNVLLNAFVFILLLHTFGISVFTFSLSSGISIFLFTTCALIICFFWPVRKNLLVVGVGNLLCILGLYLIFKEPDIFYYHLINHLVFGIIFLVLSRSVFELKVRDIQSIERIELQKAELKSSNKMLRMTEHTLNSINRNMHQGIFRYEKSKGFTYANDYLANLLGYASATELITDKEAIFLPHRTLDEISRKVNEQGFLEGIESEITRKDGSKFWTQVNCSIRRTENSGVLLFEGSATDISFKKKALQEALENAAKLEQAEKIAHTGFYEINVNNAEFTYSSGMREILETNQEGSLSLQQHLSYVHPADQKKVRNTILEAIAKNNQFSLEYRIISANGNLKYLNSNAGLIRDEQKNHLKILGTAQDVTAIKLSQEALAQSEAYVKAAFNNNRFAICITDPDYKVIGFNEESSRRVNDWLGITLENGLGLLDLMKPETRRSIEPAFIRALQGHKSLLEYKFMEDSPLETWAELYVCPVKDVNELIIGTLVLGVDITERKRNEELLANLSLVASHTDNIVMISDRKHRVEWVNEAFVKNMGYQLQEVKHMFPKDFLLAENTDPTTLKTLNNCLKEGKPFKDELLIRNKKNQDRWIHLTVNPIFNENGQHVKFVSVCTDLGKIKAYESQLHVAKEKAERSAESKESFLSTVSHELRTPLNAVIGLTHHMLQNEPREDQLEDLNILKFSAENLLNLINDILDLSKIEAGKVKLEKVVFNFKEIINSLKYSFQSQAEAKGLEFHVKVEDDVPESLMGDSVRLIQILANLLSNAVKFTTHGSVNMDISVTPQPQGFCNLVVSILDSGTGIPEDKLELIFEKFEQASHSTNRNFGGTGLGLAITKQLVELQGGDIKVHSRYGKGTCFTVSLTYQIPQLHDLEPPVQSINHFDDADVKKLSVLLVEDNVVNQAVAGKFLKTWKIPFIIAQNGEEAVQKARETYFNLILMDLQMPIMDGYEATTQIRLLKEFDYSLTPIIAITATGSNGIDRKIFAAGMNDMVLKPFKPEDLLTKIHQYCPFKVEQFNDTVSSMLQAEAQSKTSQYFSLDMSGIMNLAGEDTAFLTELIKLYVEQFTILRQEAQNGLQEQDVLELRRIFHKIKPSVAMLRQEKMQQLGNEIHCLLHHEMPDFLRISPLILDFIGEMDKLMDLLKKELRNHNLVLD